MTKTTLAAGFLACMGCAGAAPQRADAPSRETPRESLVEKAFRESQTPDELRSER
jgi:hypothetical protein